MPQNRLAQSTSPYLLQHADNPVDWWPWCDEALQLAREQNKPILLSIGYSACHWCHVMAHESFEDDGTAAVMNELFINIKVDREERPDLDKVYQTAHQLLSRRSGGWPLTVFLMPDDHSPFFAGTYFPKQARHGLPAFVDLMRQIHQAYHTQAEEIAQQNTSLQQAMARLQPQGRSAQLNDQPIQAGIQQLHEHYDEVNGGIGSAPKFPHPNTLEFLLRHSEQTDDTQTRQMALFTLQQMANGGMNDLLGGGFCRYSVDDLWMIPHFEKMLYDNGPLLGLYADAWQADQQRPLFKHVCERTAEWVMREMQAPAGGYYASLDADSEGEEGKFYVWQRDEVIKLLDDELTFTLFAARYGLNNEPNFEGHWHLHSFAGTKTLAKQHSISERDVRRHLKTAREILFAAREQRIRPGTDDKILTSWNALMIKGMAQAGHLLQQPTWLASAEQALAYLREHHWHNGRLLATSKDSKAHLNAYLDDYAYLLDALLSLLQARWRNEDLAFAQALGDALLAHFYDAENGGFYFTSDDHEQLMQRMKSLSDDAMPSGNAVAAQSLQRLGLLLGETRYLDAAEKTLQAAWDNINRMPYAHPGLLIALAEYLQPVETLIIRGSGDELLQWQTSAQQNYAPHRQVYAIPTDCPDLPEALASKAAQETTVAYRCTGLQCDPPITNLNQL